MAVQNIGLEFEIDQNSRGSPRLLKIDSKDRKPLFRYPFRCIKYLSHRIPISILLPVMRLLEITNVTGDDVNFKLVNREGNLDYAILSHTWGKDSDELSFEDMEKGIRCDKIGFQKVKRFLAEAWQADLKYGWVDTCCIDKKSSAELSEAINSMFQWYRDAKCCFVYLSDFEGHHTHLTKAELTLHLQSCRWFTRGWTLQELLAPRGLIFYSRDWQVVGDGNYLKDIIAKITGIHEEALTERFSSNNLDKFSIAQRMSWASKRETTRIEDVAYCLMGIFDVNMPLLYGEGERAFTRLQEHIIRESDDQTIFCWLRGSPDRLGDKNVTSSFLAISPRDFQESYDYIPSRTATVRPYKISNTGLKITGKLQDHQGHWGLLLHCYNKSLPLTCVVLPLVKHCGLGDDQGNQFSRVSNYLSQTHDGTAPERTIYISKTAAPPPQPRAVGNLVTFSLKADDSLMGELEIEEVYPSTCWNPPGAQIHAGYDVSASGSITNFSWHAAVKMLISNHARVIAIIGYNGRQSKP